MSVIDSADSLAEACWQWTARMVWPWVRLGLWLVGATTVVSLVVFTVRVHQYEHRTGRRYALPPTAVSPVAVKVAAKLAPQLKVLAESHKTEIIAASGNAVQRFAVTQVFPYAIKAIPKGAEYGCDAALDYLDTLKASEVAGMLVDHASSKGRQADWTVRAAAGVGR